MQLRKTFRLLKTRLLIFLNSDDDDDIFWNWAYDNFLPENPAEEEDPPKDEYPPGDEYSLEDEDETRPKDEYVPRDPGQTKQTLHDQWHNP
jgi:hypothetical protein